jgi:hypothetical protein
VHMSRLQRSILLCGIFAGALASCTPVATRSSQAGWITLIDERGGEHGWIPWGGANWHRADGVLTADQGDGVLLSPGTYANLELRVDFWTERDTNSGIFIRCTDRKNVTPTNCYEANLFDSRPFADYATGSIVTVARPAGPMFASGRWSHIEVRADGRHLVVTLNGEPAVDTQVDRVAAGAIGIQYRSGGPVKFRRVEIRPLP